MTSTPTASVDEIADRVHRISTAIPPSAMLGGFTFNQFLIADEDPLLFHTGPRKLFPVTAAALARVLPLERLRWIAFSHVEADECGALLTELADALDRSDRRPARVPATSYSPARSATASATASAAPRPQIAAAPEAT